MSATRCRAVTAKKSDVFVLYYNDNFLRRRLVTVPVTASHLRLNTAIDGALFTRPGYTLTGWNTALDGSGQAVIGAAAGLSPARGFTRSGLPKTTPRSSPTRLKTTPQL